MVHTVTLKELRPELAAVAEKIDKRLDRYIVTKRGKPLMVIMGVDDYEGLLETLDILSDRRALSGLREGMKDLKAGRTRSLEKIRQELGDV